MISPGMNFGMGGLPYLMDAKTRSISAENVDGAKGAGAQAVPEGGAAADLGTGWKVRPCITLPAESTTTLAEIEGPGIIQHIWITVDPKAYRDCILRMYWDDEETPSVEVPLGDFFCCGHSQRVKINSMPVSVNPSGGFNLYFPLPFRKSAKITIENQRWEDIGGFFYQFDYQLTDVPADAAYLHAQWRRSLGTREEPEHLMLDGVIGKGQYVGTYLAWTQFSDGWWGEGEIKFFMDGDKEFPTICGTGTEDYFGGAWCFGDTYSTPFLGYPLWQREEGKVPKHGLYRWHIMDPIRFDEDLNVTIQELGWWPNGRYEPLTDDICSTAYWYQAEPHGAFPAMLPLELRWSR
ncbi:MAG TPA: glycoside hydrolase family 172 protein [Armatimonadota bacterium]|nr:glycoside hydrolase family 172 protein [Armatimonadota bacterium]